MTVEQLNIEWSRKDVIENYKLMNLDSGNKCGFPFLSAQVSFDFYLNSDSYILVMFRKEIDINGNWKLSFPN